MSKYADIAAKHQLDTPAEPAEPAKQQGAPPTKPSSPVIDALLNSRSAPSAPTKLEKPEAPAVTDEPPGPDEEKGRGAQYWKKQHLSLKQQYDADRAELERLKKEGLDDHRKRIAELEEAAKEYEEYKQHATHLHFREARVVKKLDEEYEQHVKRWDQMAERARKPRDWWRQLAKMNHLDRMDALTEAGLGNYRELADNVIEALHQNRNDLVEAEKRRDDVLRQDAEQRQAELAEQQAHQMETSRQILSTAIKHGATAAVAKLPPSWSSLVQAGVAPAVRPEDVERSANELSEAVTKLSATPEGAIQATGVQIQLMTHGLTYLEHVQPAVERLAAENAELKRRIADLEGHQPDFGAGGGSAARGGSSGGRYADLAAKHRL
jgi:hypothetical protein